MTPRRTLTAGLAAALVLAAAGSTRLLNAAPAPRQQSARDATPAQAAASTGVIDGVLTTADSGRPARRARMILTGGDPRISRSVTTDDEGRFTFTQLSAGQFTLSASKPGFLDVTFGQKRPGMGRPGTPIQLAAGQRLEHVSMQIPRGGVITGDVKPSVNVTGAVITFSPRVTQLSGALQDTAGRPTADYTIVVFSADARFWTPQSRRIQATRPGTDGRFTLRDLPPGSYRLVAVSDAEPGQWYDPAFLQQLVSASMPFTLGDGESRTQDLRVAR